MRIYWLWARNEWGRGRPRPAAGATSRKKPRWRSRRRTVRTRRPAVVTVTAASLPSAARGVAPAGSAVWPGVDWTWSTGTGICPWRCFAYPSPAAAAAVAYRRHSTGRGRQRRRRRTGGSSGGGSDTADGTGPLAACGETDAVRERKCRVRTYLRACTGARHVREPVRGARLLLYGTRVFYAAPRSLPELAAVVVVVVGGVVTTADNRTGTGLSIPRIPTPRPNNGSAVVIGRGWGAPARRASRSGVEFQ